MQCPSGMDGLISTMRCSNCRKASSFLSKVGPREASSARNNVNGICKIAWERAGQIYSKSGILKTFAVLSAIGALYHFGYSIGSGHHSHIFLCRALSAKRRRSYEERKKESFQDDALRKRSEINAFFTNLGNV